MKREQKLYMIGNAHIDPVWRWRWQEGFQEVKATFRSALDRMKEYEDFIFTCSAASYYEWVEENDPAMFEEIRQRVKEGRWVIVGGWWIQPDCNIPAGESFVRQGLYGQRYFEEKFGIRASVGYNVDSFGHNAMLPQILRKSGMDSYVFQRPAAHEKKLEDDNFRWRSPDGSEVLAFRLPIAYCTWDGGVEERWEELKEYWEKQGSHPDIFMFFYGVGNHGGGPTKENIEGIYRLDAQQDTPKMLFSSPNAYFEELKKRKSSLPVVSGDLFHHSSGCYSVHSGVKQWNRMAENRLLAAEKLSVLAGHFMGRSYPAKEYKQAWKNVLFNQFHDILAGTCIESAYEDARESYGQALYAAAKEMNAAVQAISWNIDIPMEEGMLSLVVFNPNTFRGRFEVETEASRLPQDAVLLDEQDRQIPFQFMKPEQAGGKRIVFVAELPALGWRTFRFAVRENKVETAEVSGSENTAENQWFSLTIDEKSGYIRSLKKKDGTECFDKDAAVPTVIEDDGDTWAHGVVIFDRKIGQFCARRVFCAEKGPVRRVIRVVSEYGASRMTQDFMVYRELDFIRVRTSVDWHEKHSMLKLLFPMRAGELRARWETSYGVAEREVNKEEYPMQKFLDVEDKESGQNGFSFLNDCKSSGSIDKAEVALTLLRSPIYAHHNPYVPEEGVEYAYIDQGLQSFNYALYPREESWEQARTVSRSRQLNELPFALFETYHTGRLPQCASLLEVEDPQALLSTVKEAEDGSGDLILRLADHAGALRNVKLNLYGWQKTKELMVAPFEIKTLRMTKAGEMWETDLLEEKE